MPFFLKDPVHYEVKGLTKLKGFVDKTHGFGIGVRYFIWGSAKSVLHCLHLHNLVTPLTQTDVMFPLPILAQLVIMAWRNLAKHGTYIKQARTRVQFNLLSTQSMKGLPNLCAGVICSQKQVTDKSSQLFQQRHTHIN